MWEVSIERDGVEHVLALVNEEAEAEAMRERLRDQGCEATIALMEFRGCGCGA